MIVVSDASPIINLSAVGRLALLQQLFGTVLIPPAVHAEVVTAGASRAGVAEVEASEWIELRSLRDPSSAKALLFQLDRGEAEAIALAAEIPGALLLIDERRGRLVARRTGVPHVGLLGILLWAKRAGHLENVKPSLDDLVGRVGFRVSPALYARVLAEANEFG